ncbi:unnamed protein product [Acanthocheilonema viteae]|uniref:Apple domain-containing protein n=1 Tax=Acanthocheilonema viteae TaxID=6277 RepID=A0A498SQJ9_ACAVI|nr:unnamed protein product [Acanthocheilonema viteae]
MLDSTKEPFVPQPAIVFSGHNDQQNHISAFDMNETSHLASNNSTFPLSFQKSPSPSYRSPEELTNNFYNVPKIANMNELLSDESIFRFFRDDNFGENYRRINETYFSQGIDVEERTPQKPFIQNSLTTELPRTTTAVNKISVQSASPSLKTFVEQTRKVLNDSISQKKDSKLATASPLALKQWEMQRTDSGQSIIKVTTVSAPIQITGRDELYHVSATENGNTIDDDNSGSNDLSSNNNQRREFTNLKENLSFPSATNQPAISVNNILTNNIPISEDNLLSTTATIETTFTTCPKLFSTILTPYQNQKTQSTTAKINLTKDITNFGAIKTTSARSLTIMETTDAQNLTLSRTSLFPEADHSSFSVLNLKASGLPPSLPPSLLFSLSSTVDDNDDLTKSPAKNTLPSNDNEGKIESKLENGGKSEIINNTNLNRNEINLDSVVPENVEFGRLNRKKIENDLTYSSNKQWQMEKDQIFGERIPPTTPLLDSNLSSVELSSILGNQIDGAFSNLIHLEKQQMGISMPKYKNSLTGIIFSQIPKQNGVNTVVIDTGSTTNTGVSIKREITKGKILEEQKSFINGHDWLANPGAIIHGGIQPLQAEIYSVKSETERRKGRHKHTQMFAVRSILNDTRMNQKSKQKKKPRKDKNMAIEQMYRKEKLAEACRGDSKDFNDSNDQASNVLVIYTKKGNSSVENDLQGTGKYQHPQQCFYVINNCALSATAPFERRIGISLMECAQFCSSLLGCLSASYSTRFAICDTYHFKFDLRGKKVMRTAWHYYLEPQTSDTSECSMSFFILLFDFIF